MPWIDCLQGLTSWREMLQYHRSRNSCSRDRWAEVVMVTTVRRAGRCEPSEMSGATRRSFEDVS